MFIVTTRPRTALQQSAMYSCSSYIRLRWSRNQFEGNCYKHLVPPGPNVRFEQHSTASRLSRKKLSAEQGVLYNDDS